MEPYKFNRDIAEILGHTPQGVQECEVGVVKAREVQWCVRVAEKMGRTVSACYQPGEAQARDPEEKERGETEIVP